EIGADWVLGGTHAEQGLVELEGSGIRYCPFSGRIVGHPSLLRGTVAEIGDDARRLTELTGVHGLDLLAYPYDGDGEELVAEVGRQRRGPVIAAGSVDSMEQIATLERLGVWGFTIGSAIVRGQM